MSGQAPGQPGIRTALDFQRQERRRHVDQRPEPGVVYRVTRHRQRGVLPKIDQANTRDLGFLVTDRCGFFLRGEAADDHTRSTPLARWRARLPARPIPCHAGALPHHENGRDRSAPGCAAAARAVRGAAGHAGRLRAVRAAGSAHRQRGLRQQRLGRAITRACRCCSRSAATTVLALACSAPFSGHELRLRGRERRLAGHQPAPPHDVVLSPQADDGNIALTGEIDLAACGGEFVLALGFGQDDGRSRAPRARRPAAGLRRSHRDVTSRGGSSIKKRCLDLRATPTQGPVSLYRVSTAVLKTHEAKRFPGRHDRQPVDPLGRRQRRRRPGRLSSGLAARPRGERGRAAGRGDVRQRAANAGLPDVHAGRRRALAAEYVAGRHAVLVRHPDGRNGVPDPAGRRAAPRWMRSTAWTSGRWCVGRRGFLVRNGPVTGQDRWEEDGGYSPFTLAVEIAALLAAADFADEAGKPHMRSLSARDRRLPGTTTSSAGRMSPARTWRSSSASKAITCASRRPKPPTPRRRQTASCRSRTARPAKATSR